MFSLHQILNCVTHLFLSRAHHGKTSAGFPLRTRRLVLQELEDRRLLSVTSVIDENTSLFCMDGNTILPVGTSFLTSDHSYYPLESWQSHPVYRELSDAEGNDSSQLVNPEAKLDFAQAQTWNDSVLLSSSEDDWLGRSVFLADDEIFLHVGYGNHGNTVSEVFTLSVYIDGALTKQFHSTPLDALEYQAISNISLGTFTAGSHGLNVILEDAKGYSVVRAVTFQSVETLALPECVEQINSQWDLNRGDYHLTWNSSSGADRYRVEYAATQALLDSTPTVAVTTATEFYLPQFGQSDSCFVKIIALNDSGETTPVATQVAGTSGNISAAARAVTDKTDPFNITCDFRTSGTVLYYYQSGVGLDSRYSYVNAPDAVYLELIEAACERWQEIIVSGQENISIYSGANAMTIDDIFITFGFAAADVSALGWSYSEGYWRSNNLRANGSIVYNTNYYGANPSEDVKTNFYYVVLHEIGHSLGYSNSCWDRFDTDYETTVLPTGLETVLNNLSGDYRIPYYTGENVLSVISDMTDIAPITIDGTNVFLLETINSPGSYVSHLNSYYATFYHSSLSQHELMNYSAPASFWKTSVSTITVAFMDDVGYDVDYSMADPYGTAAPYDLEALRTENGIELDWSVDSGMITPTTTYTIQRRDIATEGNSWTEIASDITTLNWTDTTAAATGAWQYRIVAHNLKTKVTVGSWYSSAGETLSWEEATNASYYTIYVLKTTSANNPYWVFYSTCYDTSFILDESASETIYMVVATNAIQAISDPSKAVRTEISVAVSDLAPQTGSTIHATAMAHGTELTNVSWQWYRGLSPDSMTLISDETTADYVTTADDSGMYLRAVATAVYPYYGRAQATTSTPVPAEVTGMTLSTNTPLVGQAISVSTVPQGATFTCQWYRGMDLDSMTAIENATGSSYIPQVVDAGYLLQARIVATAPFSGSLSAVTTNAVTIDLALCGLTVSHSKPLVGDTITGTWNMSDVDATYQWYAGTNPDVMSPLPGANTSSLVVTESLRGHYLEIVATGEGLYSQSASAKTTTFVRQNVTQVVLSEDSTLTDDERHAVGATLTAAGKPDNAVCLYQWFRQSYDPETGNLVRQNISNANAQTYTLTQADVGFYIGVVATGIFEYVSEAETVTDWIATAPLVAISLSQQTLFIGQEINATLDPAAATATYQWYRGTSLDQFSAIENANDRRYTPVQDDLDSYLKVVATGNGIYSGSVSAISTATVVKGLGIISLSNHSPVADDVIVATLSDPDATVTWAWYASSNLTDWTQIPNEISNSYTVTSSNAGQYLAVKATGTGSFIGNAQVSTTNYATAPIGLITIDSNELMVGKPLNASVSEANATVTWQWLRGTDPDDQTTFVALEGANDASYTPTLDDLGFYIGTVASGIDPWTGSDMLVATVPVTAVLSAAAFDSTTFFTGKMITVSPQPIESTVSYQWYRRKTTDDEWIVIPEQTSASYTPDDGDRGYYLMAELTGTGHWTGSAQAITSGVVCSQITGVSLSTLKPYVNMPVAASVDPIGAEVVYQWSRGTNESDMTNIEGATDATYTPTADDLGYYLSVTVTGRDDWQGSIVATTTQFVQGQIESVVLLNDSPVVGSTIDLTVKTVDDITNDTWPITASYQWYQSPQADATSDQWTIIESATSASYSPTLNDLGKYLVVTVQGTGVWTGTTQTSTLQPITDSIGSLELIQPDIILAGESLQASVSNPNATTVFQWYRISVSEESLNEPELIEDANESSYSVTANDVGYYIKVVASGTGNYTGTEEATSTRVQEASSLQVTTSLDVVDPYDNLTSLREASQVAASGETITFFSELASQTIELTYGEITVNKSITIDGSCGESGEQITLDARNESQHFCFIAPSDSEMLAVGVKSLTFTAGSGNTGGAIYSYYTDLTLSGCTVVANTAQYGGGGVYTDFGSLTLINSLIVANTAQYGGGVYVNTGTGSISSSTVTDNSADYGSGFYFSASSATISDSIICDNAELADIGRFSSSIQGINVLSSYKYWAADSSGTILYDPEQKLFTNSDLRDYSLVPNAQAVNKGSTTTLLQFDLAGNQRLQADHLDLGAFESPYQYFEITWQGNSHYTLINGCGVDLTAQLLSATVALDDSFEYLWNVEQNEENINADGLHYWFMSDDYQWCEGSYTIHFTLRDSDGTESNTITWTVDVIKADLSFVYNVSQLADIQLFKLNIATSGPDRDPATAWSFHWGDNTTTSISHVSFSASATHYFVQPGTYTVYVLCTQGLGDQQTTNKAVTFNITVDMSLNVPTTQMSLAPSVETESIQAESPVPVQPVVNSKATAPILPPTDQTLQDTGTARKPYELVLIYDSKPARNNRTQWRRFTLPADSFDSLQQTQFQQASTIAVHEQLFAQTTTTKGALFEEHDLLSFVDEDTSMVPTDLEESVFITPLD